MHDRATISPAHRSNASAAVASPQKARSMTAALPKPAVQTARTVVECYDFLDRFLPECGIWDLTDGLYRGEPGTPHEQAQQRQVEWLLDQVQCRRGSRILEIGCGNGRLLQTAGERGADAIGVNVSRLQVDHCRARGLDVRLMDYQEIDES
jgi:SAM-dependent methyltransferase